MSDALYSRRGAFPAPLPFSDVDQDGNTWTNLADNEAGRAATGWAEAPPLPVYDPLAQSLTWADGGWVITTLSEQVLAANLAAAKVAMRADLADVRWQRQQVMVFMDQPMPADNETITMCTAAEALARLGGLNYDTPRNWKIADGIWTVLTTTQIVAYGMAIGAHRQACFDHEKALSQQIDAAANIAALGAVEINAGWPE